MIIIGVRVCFAETIKLFDNGLNPTSNMGTGEEQGSNLLNGSDLDHSVVGADTMNELVLALSSEVKDSTEILSECTSAEELKSSPDISMSQTKRGINVKEILKSLVASPVEGLELEPESHPDPAAKVQAHRVLPVQFHSFDRWDGPVRSSLFVLCWMGTSDASKVNAGAFWVQEVGLLYSTSVTRGQCNTGVWLQSFSLDSF